MQRINFVFNLREDVEQVAQVVLVDEKLAIRIELAVADVDFEEVEDRRQAILMSGKLL